MTRIRRDDIGQRVTAFNKHDFRVSSEDGFNTKLAKPTPFGADPSPPTNLPLAHSTMY
jgi:hypothetical protein